MGFTIIQIDGFANKTKQGKNQTGISRFFFFPPCGRRNVKKKKGGEEGHNLFLETCSNIQNTVKICNIFAEIIIILYLLILLIMLLSASDRELSHKGLACVIYMMWYPVK